MTLVIKELCAAHGRWVGINTPRGYVVRRCPECPGCIDLDCGHEDCPPRRAPKINGFSTTFDATAPQPPENCPHRDQHGQPPGSTCITCGYRPTRVDANGRTPSEGAS